MPEDFNQDGNVDSGDYTIWRNQLGAKNGNTAGGGDADLDGDVDSFDYRTWKSSFGMTAAQAASFLQPVASRDDGDWGYLERGLWQTGSLSGGWQDDYRVHTPGTGNASADWVTIFEPGEYEVFATWVPDAGHAADAKYRIIDGATELAVVTRDQTAAPDDGEFNSRMWESLGTYHFSTGVPTIRLSNDASGLVVADGVLFVPAGEPCLFDDDLTQWQVDQFGGSEANQGGVTALDCEATLREGDSFLVTLAHTFEVPENPTVLRFAYEASFDTTSDTEFINDAFEAVLMDTDGNTLVFPFTAGRDAYLNHTEEELAALAPGVTAEGPTVTVDISSLLAGTQATILFRLVNNDGDTGSTVRIRDLEISPNDVLPAAGSAPAGTISGSTSPASHGEGLVNAVAGGALANLNALGSSVPSSGNIVLHGSPGPMLSVNLPASGTSLPAGQILVISGQALEGAAPAYPVRVNGQPVDAQDAAGNFFHQVEILSGTNTLMIEASNLDGATTTATVTVEGTQTPSGIDLSRLSVVSGSSLGVYGRTSWHDESSVLHADFSVTNNGQYAIDGPFLVGVANISDPTVQLRDAIGTTADGIALFDMTSLVSGGNLDPGEASGQTTISFFAPGKAHFTYDLVFFAHTNQAPRITTVPDVEAIAGRAYEYDVSAIDPDGDDVTFALLAGPAGMVLDTDTGRITMNPAIADVGNHTVIVQVDDGRGGSVQQRYVLSVIEPPPNRPPLLTSDPVVLAHVNMPYTYQVTAVDADGDELTFALGEVAPVQIAITNPSFESQVLNDDSFSLTLSGWTAPAGAQVGAFNPAPQHYPGGIVPDGRNVAYSGGPTISQVLTETLRANTRYTLTVAVGDRLDVNLPTFAVQLWAGTRMLGESSTPRPGNGAFVDVTVVYDAPAGHSALDQPLEIRLVSGGSQVNWDNVRLTASTAIGIDPTTGLISWTPTNAHIGMHDVQVLVSDGRGGTAAQQYTILVEPETDNRAPMIVSEPGTSIMIGPPPTGRTVDFEGLSATSSMSETLVPPEARLSDQLLTTHGVKFRSDSGVPYVAVVNLGEDLAHSGTNGIGGMGSATDIDFAVPIIAEFFFPEAPTVRARTDSVSIKVDKLGSNGTVILEAYSVNGTLLGSVSAVDANGPTLTLSRVGIHSVRIRGAAGTAFDDLSFGQLYNVVDFEGLPAGGFGAGAFIPEAARLSNQLLTTHGVTFRSASGFPYIGVVNLGIGHAHSGTNGFGGTVNGTNINYSVPIFAEFFLPGATAEPALTDWVSIKVDNSGAGGPVFLDGFNIRGELLGTVSAEDFGGPTLTLNAPGIHMARIRGTNTNTTAFDDLAYGELYAAALYEYDVTAIDPDNDTLAYSLVTFPAGMIIDASSGKINWNVEYKDVGSHPVTVRVEDGRGGFDTQNFVIDVIHPVTGEIRGTTFNDVDRSRQRDGAEPGLAGWIIYVDANRNGHRDQGERFTTTDSDGNYLFEDLAPGVYVVAMEGQAGWEQTSPEARTYEVTIVAGIVIEALDFGNYDLGGTTNRAPVFNSTPPTVARAGDIYRYMVSATDPDGDPLSFDLPLLPTGMAMEPLTGALVWRPTREHVGVQNVVLRVRDSNGAVALQSFEIVVSQPNSRPVITSTPPTLAVVGMPLTFQIRAQDGDGDPLVFSLGTPPAGMTVGLVSGLLKWTPTEDQIGSHTITMAVFDDHGGFDSITFQLQVVAVAENDPPSITSSPRTTHRLGSVYRYAVEVSDANHDPISLSLSTSPTGMTLDPVTRVVTWSPAASQVGEQMVEIRAEDGRGGVDVQSFTINVTANISNELPRIVSTPVTVGTADRPYQYNLRAEDVEGDPLVWSLTAAPSGMSIDPIVGTLRWTPTIDQVGSSDVTVQVTDGQGGSATQSFAVTVRAANLPPTITSSPQTRGTVGQSYSYAVAAADADGDALEHLLTVFPLGMTINAQTGVIQWTPTAVQLGAQNVSLVVRDGQGGTATQSFSVIVAAAPINRAPIITTTPVDAVLAGQNYHYDVDATDPEGDLLTYSLPTAPGMAIDPGSGVISWIPAASQAGGQPVSVIVTDAAGKVARQNFMLVVQALNRPPMITSTAVTSVTAGVTYRYDVKANDPDGNSLTFKLTAAPMGMTIDSLGRIAWPTAVPDIGTYPITVEVSDTFGAMASHSFNLQVVADTHRPNVTLQLSENPTDLNTSVTILVSASDDVGVVARELTVDGVAVTLDTLGRTTITTTTAGTFQIVATARDAAGNVGTASELLLVIDSTDVNAPLVDLTSPDDEAVITAPTQVRGTVTDDNLLFYSLLVAPLGSADFVEFARGTSNVTNNVLGTLDPTLLANDVYTLRLSATDAGGNTSIVDQTVHTTGNLKLGNFALSFTDLTVPVFGVPITVARTYDTLTAGQSGDFGFGWRLEFRDINLRTSVAPTGYEEYGIFNAFKAGSRVYVTLPGGVREAFTFRPKVAAGIRGAFLGIFEPEFVPDPGVKSSLTVTPADLRLDAEGRVFDYSTGIAYNPASGLFGGTYLLTTKDGIAFDVDAQTGLLTALSDSNNNVLRFTSAGITGPNGVNVAFERDPRGRIAAVVDPAGNRIRYQYDARGDLVAVTDRTDNTTQFVYRDSPAHYLEQVIDPLGRTGIRNEYDDQGRLTSIIDAAGNPVQFAFDPANFVATVTDALGNPITQEYDARGNIVTEIDALGGTTRRTFDADNNKLTETNPLGHTSTFTYNNRGDVLTETDPLGNVTRSTHQAFTFGTTALAAVRGQASAPFSRAKTSTDALGNTTQYAYDPVGNMVATSDPMGHTTSVASDARGYPASLTDANGKTTHYVRDAAGRVVELIDALGNETKYTYDANGNQLTSTTMQTLADGTVRTLTTRTEYDGEGRIIAVTDVEGGVSRTEYDATGNRTATINALGHRTEYRYDLRGKLVETIFPDATPTDLADNPRTRSEYDAGGRQIARIDELGRRTEYQYDAVGQLVRTIYSDATSTATEYDAAGQVTAQIDERGLRTEFRYDANGRQTMVRDELGHETTNTYDTAGRQIAFTDALGHTIRYVVDARGFQTESIYPDGTRDVLILDNRGQVVARTDQLNRTTHYEYDDMGRLISVVNSLGGRSEYGYDEAGNLIRQTDANSRVTRYEYDGLGRQTATVLPALAGQSPLRSATAYNAIGNVINTTDFNGQTITFEYDERSRLTSKAYPDGSNLEFTYTLTSQQATVTDGRGTTHFSYDTRDRLLSRTDPDGAQISYTYDVAGNRTTVTTGVDDAFSTTSYTFDALNREATVTAPGGGITRYAYDAAGNLIRTELPNGTVETRSYDDLNRLTYLENSGPNGTIDSYSYQLAPTGRRDAIVESSGRRVDYSYDALDRLTRERILDAALGDRTIDYTYDAVGNRLSRNDSVGGTTTYDYDEMDRLLTEDLAGQVTHYTYDNNGNTLSRMSATDAAFYNWDFENRLVAVDNDGDGTIDVRNEYDSNGIRVVQSADGVDTRFLVDTEREYPQVLVEYLPSGLVVASYVYGNRLLSQSRSDAASFYHVDGLGSTRALTDILGAATDRYIYDAFGRLLLSSGTTSNNYLFAGEQRDAILGFDYLRARHLDPQTGRFLSADSFPGLIRHPLTLNKFIYTAQNPVNFTDPSGHFFGFVSAISGVLNQLSNVAFSAVRYQTFVATARGVEDLLKVTAFGLQVAAQAYFGGFETGFTVAQSTKAIGKITGIELKVVVQKGQDKTLEFEMTFVDAAKFAYKLNLTNPEKSEITAGVEFKRPIANISAAGGFVTLLQLNLVIENQYFPTFTAKLSVEGEFGPGGLLKTKVPIIS